MSDIKLSIIIPCYNAEPYINELLDALRPQVTTDVQVLVIDDGSEKPFKTNYKWVKVIRQTNGGASAARNTGLDNAIGEYVAFIDADDMVANNYNSTILNKIQKEHFDYCYLSWRTLPGGWQQTVKLNSVQDKFPPFNLCVWNRIYRRDMIGDVRFNLKKLIAEDAEFIRDVKEEGKKKAYIDEFMYFYRSTTPGSLTKRFSEGKIETQRVVYYYPVVTSNMTNLIEEFKETDKYAEVILMTNDNQIPELEKYAMVLKPVQIKGTELRGVATTLFTKINIPINTQIVIYTARTYAIGGIETWIYNFCVQMHEYYDILVLYESMDQKQIERLKKIVQVERLTSLVHINCDTLIVNRITDKAPLNIHYKQKIQMVHACRMVDTWKVPSDNDCAVVISETAKKSFEADLKGGRTEVIHNMTAPSDIEGALVLVSATRLDTFEKGKARITKLAKLFQAKKIPFLWMCFSNSKLNANELVEGIVNLSPRLDILEFVKQADYLVQLSDAEGFCYSIVEALEIGTPVITTPVDVLSEIGFKDGVNGYIVPFDVENVDVDKIYHQRLKGKFTYKYDNDSLIKQWRGLLGDTTPTHRYDPNKEMKDMVEVGIIKGYKDCELNRIVNEGEHIFMRSSRAKDVVNAGYGIYVYGK